MTGSWVPHPQPWTCLLGFLCGRGFGRSSVTLAASPLPYTQVCWGMFNSQLLGKEKARFQGQFQAMVPCELACRVPENVTTELSELG